MDRRHVSRYDDDWGGINPEGTFKILYVGADYVLAPGILIGALAEVDDTDEDIDDPTVVGSVGGTGWTVGPYVGIRLRDNLFLRCTRRLGSVRQRHHTHRSGGWPQVGKLRYGPLAGDGDADRQPLHRPLAHLAVDWRRLWQRVL